MGVLQHLCNNFSERLLWKQTNLNVTDGIIAKSNPAFNKSSDIVLQRIIFEK